MGSFLCRVQQKAQAFDSKYGVRRKFRNLGDDFQRNLPGVSEPDQVINVSKRVLLACFS